MKLWPALQHAQSGLSNEGDSNEGTTACALAIATMAIEHCERCLRTLVANGATGTPALKWNYDR